MKGVVVLIDNDSTFYSVMVGDGVLPSGTLKFNSCREGRYIENSCNSEKEQSSSYASFSFCSCIIIINHSKIDQLKTVGKLWV